MVSFWNEKYGLRRCFYDYCLILVTYLANILFGAKTNNDMAQPLNIAILIAQERERL